MNKCGAAVLSRKYFFPNLRKQPTFLDATAGFPAKWHLRNKRRNSSLTTLQHPNLKSASDYWLKQISHEARPIRSTTQIRTVRVISMEFLHSFCQTSIPRETSAGVEERRLSPQTTATPAFDKLSPKTLLGENHKMWRLNAHLLPSGDLKVLPRKQNTINRVGWWGRLTYFLDIHCHKSITETLDFARIAKRFPCATNYVGTL